MAWIAITVRVLSMLAHQPQTELFPFFSWQIESSTPTNFRSIGTLLRLNPDGTRVVRLTKPPHGPYGFYIAKGGVEFNYGELGR